MPTLKCFLTKAEYDLLLKAYEATRLDEARDAVVIQVIDKATPPEKRAKPKRRLMVMVATLTGFFLSIFIAFILEYKNRALENPEDRKRLELLKEHLRFRLPFRSEVLWSRLKKR